jgi:hypothetical protein
MITVIHDSIALYQIKMNKYNVKLPLYPFLLTHIDFQIIEWKKSTEYPHDFYSKQGSKKPNI